MSKKKWGSPTSLNRTILAKLSFWPKVLYLPTNRPPCARSMNDVAPLRHEFACAVGMRKNNGSYAYYVTIFSSSTAYSMKARLGGIA